MKANEAQKKAIETTEGPLLIIAGPGSGKTFTLVQRAVYLISEKGVEPKEILIATFTNKAALELKTRISYELKERKINININDMYIGTFHSICRRILKEYSQDNQINDFKLLDSMDQEFFIYKNYNEFKENIPGIVKFIPIFKPWRKIKETINFLNKLSEELVDPKQLMKDKDEEIKIIGEALEYYNKLLEKNNCIDFASLQVKTYELLNNNKKMCESIQNQIKYLMIDEYQDTNYIQEQLIFLISKKHKNICVVGDDDQGLYRFRGATIRNMLEFSSHFEENECKKIELNENYRSNSDIVAFFNKWITTTKTKEFSFSWDKYRFKKEIFSKKESKEKVSVIKIQSEELDNWCNDIASFIKKLENNKKITDYNQIAFLFKSVQNEKVKYLANYLEGEGIGVYSPRSNLFFDRQEIKLLIGILLNLFPDYKEKVKKYDIPYSREEDIEYYNKCINTVNEYYEENNKDILNVRNEIKETIDINQNILFSEILYRVISLEPFRTELNKDIKSGINKTRAARNIAKFISLICKYEYLFNIYSIKKEYLEKDLNNLFGIFFVGYLSEATNEYEDEEAYAPSGCVSFLTIHQSKGMEFPIVVVGSLWDKPREKVDKNEIIIEQKYYKREPFEPIFIENNPIPLYDFWRLYYTAFSRAQDLLVLTSFGKRNLSKYFKPIIKDVEDGKNINTENLDISLTKEASNQKILSFTSNIKIYENCSVKYKYYNELRFPPLKENTLLFGRLVHEVIEQINKKVIINKQIIFKEDEVRKLTLSNYNAFAKNEHLYLAPNLIESAIKHIMNYVNYQQNNWYKIDEAEINLNIVKEDYIMEGKIDLISCESGEVDLIDFKTESLKKIKDDPEIIKQYKKQLLLYAYLVEEKLNKKVRNIGIFLTGEESEPLITYKYCQGEEEQIINEFDEVARKIVNKEFITKAKNERECKKCDFYYFCNHK